MRAYIATRLENHAEHNQVRDRLAEVGIGLTSDWTVHGSVRGSAQRLRDVGAAEVAGVRDADVVVVLLPGGRGTHVELGIAIGAGKPVLLVGRGPDFDPFSEQTCALYYADSVVWWNRAAAEALRPEEDLADRIAKILVAFRDDLPSRYDDLPSRSSALLGLAAAEARPVQGRLS